MSFNRKNDDMVRESPDEIEKLEKKLSADEHQKLLEIIRVKLNKNLPLTSIEQEFLDNHYSSFSEHFNKKD